MSASRDNLQGFRGDGPVRIGNAAAEQAQHDTYGSIILAAMPMFFDRRLPQMGDDSLFRLLEVLGRKAERLALTPDAGIWEYRGRQRIHTHSVAMCWAGCNRLAAIAHRLGFVDRANYWNDVADRLHAAMMEHAWNEKRGAFTAAFGSDDLDASVLLLHELGVVEAEDPRFVSTVAAIERELLRGNHVMRYASPDDFGVPEGEFLICRFWLIDAWWALGRKEEARDLFVDALQYTQSLRAAGRAHPHADRPTVGQFPADLFDGGTDSHRDASVAKLGGSVLARLVVVSNRVSVAEIGHPRRRPRGRGHGVAQAQSRHLVRLERTRVEQHAGDPHDRRRPVSPTSSPTCRRKPTTNFITASPTACCGRSCITGSISRNSRARTCRAIPAINEHFADELHKILKPDDVIWVHDYHFLLLRKGFARARAQEPHRLLPAHAVSAGRDHHRLAASRA